MTKTVGMARKASPNGNTFRDVAALERRLADCLTTAQVAKATRSSQQAVRNWCDDGLRGPDGKIYKLRCFRVGARRFVEPEDLALFLEALNS
jgi:hypothetical protein